MEEKYRVKAEVTQHKVNRREKFLEPDWEWVQERKLEMSKPIKRLPNAIASLIRTMYSKRCKMCVESKEILNFGHLEGHHHEKNEPVSLIDRLQGKNHRSARSDLNRLLQRVMGLARQGPEERVEVRREESL